MYAITKHSYRAVDTSTQLAPGETLVHQLPADLLMSVQGLERRSDRDRLLRESDWTQATDSPLTPEAVLAWAVYRQELRDMPERPGFPNCAWPVPPALHEGAAGQERAPLHN
ncbi:TPA: phage tail assembly chaperone [Stenotrophomonas maltophilia]|nr:phage tail assembly chaperone [Stenotrophomonas maltophilia]